MTRPQKRIDYFKSDLTWQEAAMQQSNVTTTGNVQGSLKSLPSDELVNLAREGKAWAFHELTTRYHRMVFKATFDVLKNVEDAEDAVQDALLNAYTKLASFRGESRFSTWLVRIAINTSLMHLRKKRNRPTVGLEDFLLDDMNSTLLLLSHDLTPEQLCSEQEQAQRLRDAMKRLPIRLQDVFEAHVIHDLSIRETAALHGLSVAATKSRLLRARNALCQQFNGRKGLTRAPGRPNQSLAINRNVA